MSIEILLAAYNGSLYLPDLLSSLTSQTEPNFSVLYQDDGSSDGTAALLEAQNALDPRFRPGLEQGRHMGAKKNFLSLLRQSSADLVFLCDQDDLWVPDKIRTLTEIYRRSSSELPEETPILIHSDAVVTDENNQLLADSFFRLQGWDPEAVTLNRLLVQNNVTGCTAVLNRPLADLVARFGIAESMFMHDWFIALTAASFGRVLFCPQKLVRYRQHGNNTIGASRKSLIRRAFSALTSCDAARERIELTFRHARAFQDMFGETLSPEATRVIRDYLATQDMPKIRRIAAWKHQGTLMQNPVTRLGQFFFA